jgi:MFS family permease
MTAHTISISQLTKLSIKKLKRLFFISLPVMLLIFLIIGLFNNLFIFGVLFISFGIFGSVLYTFLFKLIIYRNLVENSSKYSNYFETSSGLGFFISPIIIGFIANIYLSLEGQI